MSTYGFSGNRLSAALIFVLVVAGNVATFTTARADKVHLIVAYDDTKESGLGTDIKADKASIEGVFRSHVPRQQLSVVSIPGSKLTPQTILTEISRLDVKPRQDSIVFYFTGHGAYDRQRNEHVFTLPNRQNLARSDVERALTRKEPRTAVTISDCCAGYAQFKSEVDRAPKGLRIPTKISPLFRHLFLDYSGLISLTSSQPGELSITRGDGLGSLFTYPFAQYLDEHANATRGWDRVYDGVSAQVAKDFERITKGKGIDTDGNGETDQMTQTVHKFVITPRLGMRVFEQSGVLRVSEVIPLSPAYQAGIEVGDALLTINNRNVKTEKAYSDAVDATRGNKMKLKVQDHRSGKAFDIQATLNPQ